MGNSIPRRPSVATTFLAILCVVAGGCVGAIVKPTVSMMPATATVRVGDSQQFSATVNGLANPAITWTVNGIAGGNSTVGTISTNGVYQPPATLPNPNTVTVAGTITANPTLSGTSTITLENPIPVVSAINPTNIGLGSFDIEVTGNNFVKASAGMFGNTALTTTFISATQLTATGSATASGSIPVTVQNPNPGEII